MQLVNYDSLTIGEARWQHDISLQSLTAIQGSPSAPHLRSSTPVARARRDSQAMPLHTASSRDQPSNGPLTKANKHSKLGEPSKAPIQGLTTLQQAFRSPSLGASPGQWSLMTANTTNWMGAKTLITAFGREHNPGRPTFIALQQHRNARPIDCKQAEDWSRRYCYNVSFSPAASTGKGMLNTSGGWRWVHYST